MISSHAVQPGFCYCGCGQGTGIVKHSDRKRGTTKGDYRKFAIGHGTRYTTRINRPNLAQPEDSSIRHIALTRGKVAVVDAENYDWLNQFNWIANTNHGLWYAERWTKNGRVSMHNLVLGMPDHLPDHKDGDGLNNRRRNLRPATYLSNSWNQKARKSNPTRFKGISISGNRWRSRILVDKARLVLGSFATPEEAARAYDKAAIKYFGEFANLNFPLELPKLATPPLQRTLDDDF